MAIGGNTIFELWRNFKSGDKEAFAHFYNLYVDVLYRYGTKLTANEELVKDAIHEVFLDLYLKRGKNKTNPENLKYYLILALKRNLIKKLKHIKNIINHDIINELLFEPVYSIEKNIVEMEEHAELNNQVNNALNQLPAKQKEVLYLRFNESLEYIEIAGLMNISIESVRKQVYRALKTVRELFENDLFIFLFLFERKK
jgi:RNA polymerase sigma factor (sigma-70 family)